MGRDGLNIPTYNTCKCSIFCFILFHAFKEKVCREFFCNLCIMVPEYYYFEMFEILTNILEQTLAKVTSPLLSKKPALKLLKLNS